MTIKSCLAAGAIGILIYLFLFFVSFSFEAYPEDNYLLYLIAYYGFWLYVDFFSYPSHPIGIISGLIS
jgi:hypothetical protein